MGDTLWSTPAIRAIKKKLTDSQIDLLIQPRWQSLFNRNKYISHLFFYYPQWYRQLIILPNLLRFHYDHVFIFHANKDIRRILPLLRCTFIWSHQYPNAIPGISENQIIRIDKPTHGIHRRIEMLKKIQVPLNGTNMDIFIDQKNHKNAQSYLKNNNIKSKEFIYLNVGGSLPHKQWPVEQFIALAKVILKNTSLSIIFGGGPDDIRRINSINNQIKEERIAFTKQRTLGDNCALIDNAKIIITPDSGPMHIGLALKVPTISLWPTIGLIEATGAHGAIDPMNGPDYCGPLNIDNSLSCVLRGNFFNKSNIVPTSIYSGFNNKEIKVEPYHLETISVNDVWGKILKFL